MSLLVLLGLVAAFAAGTLVLGWWGVIAVALAAGALLVARRHIAATSAVAALLAWVALLAWTFSRGDVLAFGAKLAGAMGVPSFAPLVLTLVFPMLLGWSGAAVGQGVVGLFARARRR